MVTCPIGQATCYMNMQLYSHQKAIIEADPKKCGLFLGTGGGKTRIALMLAKGKTLVICPKTVRDAETWENETNKLSLPLDITVWSKEDLKKYAPTNLAGFDTIICDEAHTLAGVTPSIQYKKRIPYPKTSQIFEILTEYIAYTKPERLYLLTATPTRSPFVVWGLSQLAGKIWDFYKFRDIFYFKLPFGREIYTAKKDEKTKELLGSLVRKIGYTGKLSEWFDVPPQTFRTVYLDLTKEQKEKIIELTLDYPDPLVLCGKKHQVENGTLAGEEGQYIKDEKIEKILDLALEFPKMVIFAKYTLQIKKIKKALEKDKYKVFTIQGDTKNRKEILENIESSDSCILIVQSSISAGWEIPSVPVMVFASLSYSVSDHIQALGRIQRLHKLKKNLMIYLVVKGGVDEAVYKCIKEKEDFHEKIYIVNQKVL